MRTNCEDFESTKEIRRKSSLISILQIGRNSFVFGRLLEDVDLIDQLWLKLLYLTSHDLQ